MLNPKVISLQEPTVASILAVFMGIKTCVCSLFVKLWLCTFFSSAFFPSSLIFEVFKVDYSVLFTAYSILGFSEC